MKIHVHVCKIKQPPSADLENKLKTESKSIFPQGMWKVSIAAFKKAYQMSS